MRVLGALDTNRRPHGPPEDRTTSTTLYRSIPRSVPSQNMVYASLRTASRDRGGFLNTMRSLSPMLNMTPNGPKPSKASYAGQDHCLRRTAQLQTTEKHHMLSMRCGHYETETQRELGRVSCPSAVGQTPQTQLQGRGTSNSKRHIVQPYVGTRRDLPRRGE